MEINISTSISEKSTQTHLPWHKPEIQKLVISIDTNKIGNASSPDGFGNEEFNA